MTLVMRVVRAGAAAGLLWAALPLCAQAPTTAAALYEQLRSVGLDATAVYHIRDADLDIPGAHVSFTDGQIAFTQAVGGQVTGAFFAGEGEVLVVPPDRAERASLGLFTGAAVLEEKFFSAYLRFNGDTREQLKPFLRSSGDGSDFAARWNEMARNLAEGDALRLLLTASRDLPLTEPGLSSLGAASGHFLHARMQGAKLGVFDLFYDSWLPEPLSVGKLSEAGGANFYDQWLSFVPRRQEAVAGAGFEAARISKVRIRAEVAPPQEFRANTELTLQVAANGERALLFELSRALQVEQVEVNGKQVEFLHNPSLEGSQLARRGNDLVAVIFPRPLIAGETLNLRFVYHGEVLSEAGSGLLWVGARGTWYPNLGFVDADFDLQFRYPEGWTLVATGVPAPVEKDADIAIQHPAMTQVARWVTERKIPVAGFNLGKYAKASARAGEVLVESYAASGVERSFPRMHIQVTPVPGEPGQTVVQFPPAVSPARNAQAVADQAAEAVATYARQFGPYPYGKLSLTQMPGSLSQGWPGLVFLSSYAFLTPEERVHLRLETVSATMSAQVAAHEVAHQWWGDLMGWHSYRDQWLFEALANYCSLLLLERRDPAAFRMVMERYRDDLLRKSKDGAPLSEAGPVTLGLRLSSSRFPEGYIAISYGRGTWLFHMLRSMINEAATGGDVRRAAGEEPFVRVLRRLRQEMEGKSVTTARLLHAFEEELPPSLRYERKKSLAWFLDGWVNGKAVPGLQLKGVRIVRGANQATVSGTLEQKDAPADLVTSVPIYAVVPDKPPQWIGRVFADGAESSFRLTAPVNTRRIVLDPDGTVLAQPR